MKPKLTWLIIVSIGVGIVGTKLFDRHLLKYFNGDRQWQAEFDEADKISNEWMRQEERKRRISN